MKKILIDADKNGIKKDWKQNKIESIKLANYLYANGYKSAAKRIYNCCDILTFARDQKGDKKLKRAWFCKNRLCPQCQTRKAILNYKKVKRVLERVKMPQNTQYMFNTFTSKNVDAEHVNQEVKKLNKAITKLFNYKDLKNRVLGRVKSIEVKYKASQDSYNVHAHILMLVKETINNGRNRINHKKWNSMWRRALKTDYTPIVKITLLKAENNKPVMQQAISIGSYIGKATNYIKYVHDYKIKNKTKVINAIYQSVRYRSKTSFSGVFLDANEEIIANKNKSLRKTKYLDRKQDFKALNYETYAFKTNTNGNSNYYKIRYNLLARS